MHRLYKQSKCNNIDNIILVFKKSILLEVSLLVSVNCKHINILGHLVSLLGPCFTAYQDSLGSSVKASQKSLTFKYPPPLLSKLVPLKQKFVVQSRDLVLLYIQLSLISMRLFPNYFFFSMSIPNTSEQNSNPTSERVTSNITMV